MVREDAVPGRLALVCPWLLARVRTLYPRHESAWMFVPGNAFSYRIATDATVRGPIRNSWTIFPFASNSMSLRPV